MVEVRAEAGRALVKGDKAVVNLGMKKDGVVVEGGDAQTTAYTPTSRTILQVLSTISWA